MREWADLTKDEQTALRLAYQDEIDRNPRTCSMDEKVTRFTNWLATSGVAFSAADLSPNKAR
ncbi:hypothetical protein BD830_10496 [Maritimibacter alkaliphilus HTCC2654]|uniref:Uncharacterized protein n=1 Tax=Maritimibacter alkaliphilus HTCC2654 TaxID=314271 RepID=A3V9M0_9RHOB|nr:hypothetical protein [Maritimibacter alkaliphilus]EAQ14611.1 hypothetical protein RB2654_18548 [Maritimibacter alkaliphilus HTCC2654]TYP82217.1 hypothetical protein BD830_10496 [Maritimibacter alkaliphilus HTCC2654]